MKKKKLPVYDDGRTIVDMNVDGMPWYNPNRGKEKKDVERPRFKEKMAMIFGAYRATLPFLLLSVAAFVAAALLLFLWLS